MDETGHRLEPDPLRGAQATHPRNHAVGGAAAADEQRLDHTETSNRSLEVIEPREIIARRLDLGNRNLTDRSGRRIAQQLIDVVRRVPHAESRGQSLANASRRLVLFVVLLGVFLGVFLVVFYFIDRTRPNSIDRTIVASVERMRSRAVLIAVLVTDNVPRLPREHFVFAELSDVCGGGFFGTDGIKVHEWSPHRPC